MFFDDKQNTSILLNSKQDFHQRKTTATINTTIQSSNKRTFGYCYDITLGLTHHTFQFCHHTWLLAVILILATQMTSLAESKLISFDERSLRSSYQLDVNLFKDESYTSHFPQDHVFTTQDTIYIQVQFTFFS